MIPVTVTPNSINLLLDGRMRTVSRSHLNYARVSQIVKDLATMAENLVPRYLDELRNLLDIPTFVAKVTEGRVQVGEGSVKFDGQDVKGVIAARLLSMLKEGYNVRPLAKFLDRVAKNPDIRAQDEIYLFLESGNMPITEDGCFLAFKKVNKDYSSSHAGPDGKPFYNKIGTSPWMPRDQVDPDRYNTCSRGLHFCSFQYLPNFGMGPGARVVICKIAPEDVVSIPADYNNSKGRAWRYTIVDEVPEHECAHLFNGRSMVDNQGLYDGREDDVVDETHCAACECTDDSFNPCVDEPDEEEAYFAAKEATQEDEYIASEEAVAQYLGVCGAASQQQVTVVERLTFQHGKRVFSADEVKRLTDDYGQRGFSRMTGVPRSTIQGWLEKIKNA